MSLNKLVNPTSYLIPVTPWPRHLGGSIVIGPDNNLYISVGGVDESHKAWEFETETQNFPDGAKPDGRGGILRITLDGEPVSSKGIIGDETPLNLYYAYGVRYSFGINFDPITGNLWDTKKWTKRRWWN